MPESSIDPRRIANLILDFADQDHRKISPLALQKLLYFCHGLFLIRFNAPLVSGYFEAWQRGPVHPVVYRSFKAYGSKAISGRATSVDLRSGEQRELAPVEDSAVRSVVRSVVANYGGVSPSTLVKISHAADSPWDVIVKKAQREIALGLRIPDAVTRSNFKYQKVSVPDGEPPDAPFEDTPFTAQ